MGVYTDVANRSQLLIYDTPGVTKASNSLRSKLLITKAWQTLQESDHVLLIVDSAKRLNFEVKEAIQRLRKVSMDPQERKIMQAMQDDSFSEEAFNAGYYNLTDKEKELAG